MTRQRKSHRLAVIAPLAVIACLAMHGDLLQGAQTDVRQKARRIVQRIGTDRGICVLVSSEPAELAIAVARESELTVYAQAPSDSLVDQAR